MSQALGRGVWDGFLLGGHSSGTRQQGGFSLEKEPCSTLVAGNARDDSSRGVEEDVPITDVSWQLQFQPPKLEPSATLNVLIGSAGF